jgi:chromatin structure-remodeling complex subunit RSC1/2
MPRPSIDAQGDSTMSNAPRRPSSTAQPVPPMMPGSAYHATTASPVPSLGRPTPYQQSHTNYTSSGLPHTPSQPQTYAQPVQATPSAAHPSSYNAQPTSTGQPFASRVPQASRHVATTAQTYQQPASASAAASSYQAQQPAQRHPEVYVMSDAANSSIPLSIRQQFPCDDHGRVLWFTTPPLNNPPGLAEVVSGRDGKVLAHTPEYLAKREEKRKLIEERRMEREKEREREKEKRAMGIAEEGLRESGGNAKRRKVTDPQIDGVLLQNLTDQILDSNKKWYKVQYGDQAAEVEVFHAQRSKERMAEVEEKKRYVEGRKREAEERRERERRLEGRVFRDDWDERY